MKHLIEVEEVVGAVIRGEQPFSVGLKAVATYQAAWNRPLAAFWRRQGFDPSAPLTEADAWRVPAVATELFSSMVLVSAEAPATSVYRTSGTTSGRRGEHHRLSTALYDAGAAIHFRRCVLPGLPSPSFVKLVFDPALVPDSSLSHMVRWLERSFSRSTTPWLLGADGVRFPETASELRAGEQEPVVVFATAFALAMFLDHSDLRVQLAPGSRVVETGGFKGKSRVIPKEELYRETAARLGLSVTSIVSEYSMTELSSQLYSQQWMSAPSDLLLAPPWCRVFAIDPATGEPAAPGAPGLLRFVDLANCDTVVSVQTADRGVVHPHGVELLGRASGAPPRGCALAVEELMAP